MLSHQLWDERDRILTLLAAELDKHVTPDSNEDVKEKLAKRQANAAVDLLIMDQPEKLWPLLKHSKDPTVRSYLIHLLGPSGIDIRVVLNRLKQESDVTIRRALLLSLGEFGEVESAAGERDLLMDELRDLYRNDPDAGLHGAVEWLLRQWKQDEWLKQIIQEWAEDKQQRERRLEQIRHELPSRERPSPDPRWYVNGQGQTMVVIPRHTKFMMGSPKTEGGRDDDEQVQQPQVIGRTFAIAAKSVTFEQFLRFPNGQKHVPRLPSARESPVGGVTWYLAAEYCNWLSQQEGLPEEEWCYKPNKDGKYEAAPDYLKRTGYRLATQAEWECSCRARAMTSRYYGESIDLLGKYAWYVGNSGHQPRPVASLKPNDWGLFDMHGNVFTWCQEGDANVTDTEPIRGGSLVDHALEIRAARRIPPIQRVREDPYIGLRPARTFR
jgi:formylglycine-generating enzyme required for sulfatase activity